MSRACRASCARAGGSLLPGLALVTRVFTAPTHPRRELAAGSIEGVVNSNVHILVRVIALRVATDDQFGARNRQEDADIIDGPPMMLPLLSFDAEPAAGDSAGKVLELLRLAGYSGLDREATVTAMPRRDPARPDVDLSSRPGR